MKGGKRNKMESKFATWPVVISVIIALVLGYVSHAYLAGSSSVDNSISDEDAAKIAALVVVPAHAEDNSTAVKLDAIQAEVSEDDTWEAEATSLAEADWGEHSYRALFDAMVDANVSIVEKSDIDHVVVIDSDVTSFDVDEKDATVVQEVKVYYEDSSGEDHKVYITIETIIVDGEVEDQYISLD